MKLHEILGDLQRGKKVRREDWLGFLQLNDDSVEYVEQDPHGHSFLALWNPTTADIAAEDWIAIDS